MVIFFLRRFVVERRLDLILTNKICSSASELILQNFHKTLIRDRFNEPYDFLLQNCLRHTTIYNMTSKHNSVYNHIYCVQWP